MFSPDGEWIAYFVRSDLYKIQATGGEPIRLYAGDPNMLSKGGVWTDKGIIFCPAPNAGLVRVPEQGGDPETLTAPDKARNEVSHRWPDILPDGRHVLFTIKKSGILTFDDAEIGLLDLQTKTWKTVIRGGAFARYVPTGHIAFARNGSVLAVPFDPGAADVMGTPIVVVADVMTEPGSGAAQFAIARGSGTLVYVPGGSDEPRRELVWIGWDGKVLPVGAPPLQYGSTLPSPDGKKTASVVFGANDAIFVYDFARGTNTRVTFRGNSGWSGWTPDGSKLVFSSDADGPFATYIANADGSGEPRKVLDRAWASQGAYTVVNGKETLVYEEAGDIWIQGLDEPAPRKLVGSQFAEAVPHLSRDGRWLSYASNESGSFEVYVRPFPSGDGRWQISVGGGRLNWWSPAGDFIIYAGNDERSLFKVAIHAAAGIEADRPQALVTLPDVIVEDPQMSADGQRILAIREVPRKFTADRVCAVLNWFDELKAKVPAGSK
jgi:serine/threonine-protein kinase